MFSLIPLTSGIKCVLRGLVPLKGFITHETVFSKTDAFFFLIQRFLVCFGFFLVSHVPIGQNVFLEG